MNSYQNFEMNAFNPMYIENETLKKRLDYLETVISSAERFESTRTIVDLKSFINDSYKKFTDLIEEIYKTKQSYEYEKLKCTFLEKKIMVQHDKKEFEDNPNEIKEKEIKKQKIQDLEERIGSLTKEIDDLKSKNEKFQKLISKKDFFREYDYMCKEVEGLRKQNFNLTELIKRMQNADKPEDNEEAPDSYN